MKKTKRTLLTAAAFAAAFNMAANANVTAADTENTAEAPVNIADYVNSLINGMNGGDAQDSALIEANTYMNVTTTALPDTTELVNDITKVTKITTNVIYGPPWVFTSTATTDLPQPVYGPPSVYGDLDMDGKVDIFDLVQLRKLILKDNYNEYMKHFGDVNQDGELNIADLVAMQNYLIGRNENFDDRSLQDVYGPPPTEELHGVYGPPPTENIKNSNK